MNEEDLIVVLSPLVGGRVFPDLADDGAALPYITFQQVGGMPVNFTGAEASDKKNARMRIVVWSQARMQAMSLIRQIENLVVAAPLLASIETGAIARVDEQTRLRGAMQDFSFWFDS